MNDSVIYRIVGAAVLMALAVIFVPMLLDGSGRKEVTTVNIEMPAEPEFVFSTGSDSAIEVIEAFEDFSEIGQNEAEAAPEAEVTAKKDSSTTQQASIVEAPAVTKDTPAELRGWVVQVAALSSKEKALALQQQLVEKKYDVFIERTLSQSKEVYRVKVGPSLDEESMKRALKKIESDLGLKGMIVKLHPELQE